MDVQNLFNLQINNLTNSSEKREAFQKVSLKSELAVFRVENKKVYFVNKGGAGFDEKNNDVFVNKVKLFLKKRPWVFSTIYHLMNPSWSGTSANMVISKYPSGSIILNLGSGV